MSRMPPEDFRDANTQDNKTFIYKHAKLPFNILYHACFLSIFSIFGDIVINSMILSFIVTEYFIPGWAKLNLDNEEGDYLFWAKNDKIGYLHYWSTKFGWGTFYPKSMVLWVTKFLNKYNFFFNTPVLIIEFLGLLFFLSIYSQYIWLSLTILFHLIVFVTAGILFWQNIIILGLAFFITNYSILLMLLFMILFADIKKSRTLAWITSPLCEKIDIMGVQEDGKEVVLSNDNFGARERTVGIEYGRLAFDMQNYKVWHLGEGDYTIIPYAQDENIEEMKRYKYKISPNNTWLSYFRSFMKFTEKKHYWIWDKIIPEGQIYYLQPDKYKFEKPLEKIYFVFKVYYLDSNYVEHSIINKRLKLELTK